MVSSKKYSLYGIAMRMVTNGFLNSMNIYIDKKNEEYRLLCLGETTTEDNKHDGPWGDYFFNPVDASGNRVHSVLDELVVMIVLYDSYPKVSEARRTMFNGIKARGGKCSPAIASQKKYNEICNRELFEL